METTSIIASIVSIIIGGFAVWLAVTFYKMSTKISEGIKEAAKDISTGISRLEKLFDKLYADTFGMMKETVSDMRKHLWPEKEKPQTEILEETEKKAEEKIINLKEEIQSELKKTLHKQKLTDEKISLLSKDMSKLLDKTIMDSRKVDAEAKEEALRNYLLKYILNPTYPKLGVKADIIAKNAIKEGFDFNEIVEQIVKLRKENLIFFDEHRLDSNSIIKPI